MRFLGITPYLYYDDAAEASDWLSSTFGFEEIERFAGPDGKAKNISMRVGDGELWLDGKPGHWSSKGGDPDSWIMIWVDDVDALRDRVAAAGVESVGPMDRPWGVRELQVRDPQAFNWGFMQRLTNPA